MKGNGVGQRRKNVDKQFSCASKARSLMRETGPLLTSSANISGFIGSTTVEGISLDFPSVKILGPIPWGKRSGKASTIIFWKKSGDWRLIRKGEVIVRELY